MALKPVTSGSRVEQIRLGFDPAIPEHAVVLDRMKNLTGPARAEWLRLHLYRSVVDVEPLREARRRAGKASQTKRRASGAAATKENDKKGDTE